MGSKAVSLAYLLRRVDYRDNDLLLTFFTQDHGKLVALARGAKRSQKRFGGCLEPIHTLSIELASASKERASLKSVEIVCARTALVRSLEGLGAAGQALSWVRFTSQERQPEPRIWHLITELLDALNSGRQRPQAIAGFGLQVLEAAGWGLTLDACAACGLPCPEGRPAYISAVRGGLVCRGCGGAEPELLLQAEERHSLLLATRGHGFATEQNAKIACELVTAVLSAHAGTPAF